MLVDDRIDRLDDLGVPVISTGELIIGRPRQTDAAAASLHGEAMLGDQIRDGVTLLRRP